MTILELQHVPQPIPGTVPVPPPTPGPGRVPEPVIDPGEPDLPIGDPDVIDPTPGPDVPPPVVARGPYLRNQAHTAAF